MKNVLLLGDSIRMNYMPAVFRLLSSRAVVCGPEENCRYSKYTLWSLDDWLGERDYSVVHFNCGIWDAVRRNTWENGTFSTADEYRRTVGLIIRRIKSRGIPLIIATSTPVKEGIPLHSNRDIDDFNRILLELAEEYALPVDDLHRLISSDTQKYICNDGVHLSPEGIKASSHQVAEMIGRYL